MLRRLLLASVLCWSCTTTPDMPPPDAAPPRVDLAHAPVDQSAPADFAISPDLTAPADLAPMPPDFAVACTSTIENGVKCGCVGQPCCTQAATCHAGNLACLQGKNGLYDCFACGGYGEPCCPMPNKMPVCNAGFECFGIDNSINCTRPQGPETLGCEMCDRSGCGSPGTNCCTALPYACLDKRACVNGKCP